MTDLMPEIGKSQVLKKNNFFLNLAAFRIGTRNLAFRMTVCIANDTEIVVTLGLGVSLICSGVNTFILRIFGFFLDWLLKAR